MWVMQQMLSIKLRWESENSGIGRRHLSNNQVLPVIHMSNVHETI